MTPDPRPPSAVPATDKTRCPRDSDWCDGVICRERGIDCPNADQAREAPEAERWVNAVIEITVPLTDVTVESSRPAKIDAVSRTFDELLAALPDSFAEMVSSAHWEDVKDGEAEARPDAVGFAAAENGPKVKPEAFSSVPDFEVRALAAEAEVERWKREADDQARANMERGIELVKPLLGAMDKEGVVEVFAGSALIAEKATDRAEAAEARVGELEGRSAWRDDLAEELREAAVECLYGSAGPAPLKRAIDRFDSLSSEAPNQKQSVSSPPEEGTHFPSLSLTSEELDALADGDVLESARLKFEGELHRRREGEDG